MQDVATFRDPLIPQEIFRVVLVFARVSLTFRGPPIRREVLSVVFAFAGVSVSHSTPKPPPPPREVPSVVLALLRVSLTFHDPPTSREVLSVVFAFPGVSHPFPERYTTSSLFLPEFGPPRTPVNNNYDSGYNYVALKPETDTNALPSGR